MASTAVPARSAKAVEYPTGVRRDDRFGNRIRPQANDADAIGAKLTRQDAR